MPVTFPLVQENKIKLYTLAVITLMLDDPSDNTQVTFRFDCRDGETAQFPRAGTGQMFDFLHLAHNCKLNERTYNGNVEAHLERGVRLINLILFQLQRIQVEH